METISKLVSDIQVAKERLEATLLEVEEFNKRHQPNVENLKQELQLYREQARAVPFEKALMLTAEECRPKIIPLPSQGRSFRFGLLQLNPAKNIAFLCHLENDCGDYAIRCEINGFRSAPLICPCGGCYGIGVDRDEAKSVLAKEIRSACVENGIEGVFVTDPRSLMILGVTLYGIQKDRISQYMTSTSYIDNPESSRNTLLKLVGKECAEKSFTFCGKLDWVDHKFA